jgi:type 1 glutamine amidotransferase
MKFRPHRQQAISLALILTTWLFAGAGPARTADHPQPTDEELRKLASAGPAKATATPKQPRKLLVFTLCKGYYHVSIPYGAKAIQFMGQKTGAFTATISDDIAMFEPDALRQFDGVCFVSALGELFLPDNVDQLPPAQQAAAKANDARLKRNFFAWLRSGHGMAAIHGASALFDRTPEFGAALGGVFDSHPWNAFEKIAVKLDEPDNPLLAAFGGRGFEIIDEGYQFKEPYSRRSDRVLYSMDTARMDMNKPHLRPDHDFGLCWVRKAGEGRVFYTALGHNAEEFWNPALLRHMLDGLQFTLGDLDVPTMPGTR